MSDRKWRLLFATPPLCQPFVGLPIADLALHCRIQTQLPRRTSFCIGFVLHSDGLDWLDIGLLHFCGRKWQDVSICCGLLATPTVIILVVFIPKVRWRLCPNPFSLHFYNFPVLSFNDNKCLSRL